MATIRETLQYQPAELSFGTSGLRGLVTDMTDLECYINTVGFLHFLTHAEKLAKGSTICLAGDLRHSTPRILRAVHNAIRDEGYQTLYCGLIPTPAVAYFAAQQGLPCIMVTGSHIPADRNGIKFYKSSGEVLKEDEVGIREAVAEFRAQMYAATPGPFTPEGMLTQPHALPSADQTAAREYSRRYTDVFGSQTLAGKKVVFYQHSTVGRDILVQILKDLGAQVITVGRTDTFVPIDTENVTPDDQAYFKVLAKEHPDAFAIVSTDGDADRPFVIDEQGIFHRGDVLGTVVADWLQADFAAVPISSSDAVDKHLTQRGIKWQHTRIGSPYVITAMDEALRAGNKRVVGWEVNGGFLLGTDMTVYNNTLKSLPTRDAFLPIVVALLAAKESDQKVSELFCGLPKRYTQAGLIDNFPVEVSKALVTQLSDDTPTNRKTLQEQFNATFGFGEVMHINGIDGVRIYFSNGDIAHVRPSGNAPQLRIYSVADTQNRADEIVALAIREPDGILRKLQKMFQQ